MPFTTENEHTQRQQGCRMSMMLPLMFGDGA
jgi:hypothetical protein